MKNKEFYKEEIFNIAIQGCNVALKEGEPVPCRISTCPNCDWVNCKDCAEELRKWVEEEHTEDIFDFNDGDRFYYVNALGKVQVGIYGKSSTHYVSFGNACKDPNIMHERATEIRNYNKIANLAIKYNQGWTPNWEDEYEYKWFIAFDHITKRLCPSCITYISSPNAVYFKTKELALKAIKILEE